VEPIVLDAESLKAIEDRLLLFYLGGTRSAATILLEQAGTWTTTSVSTRWCR